VRFSLGPGAGTMTIEPGGGGGGVRCFDTPVASTVTVTAQPGPDSRFTGFGGFPGAAACGNPCTITLGPKPNTANGKGYADQLAVELAFEVLRTAWVRLWLVGDFDEEGAWGAGRVKEGPDPPGELEGCGVGYTSVETCDIRGHAGVPMTLTARPAERSVFAGWKDGPCDGQGTTCTFTPLGDTEFSVHFAPAGVGTVARRGPLAGA